MFVRAIYGPLRRQLPAWNCVRWYGKASEVRQKTLGDIHKVYKAGDRLSVITAHDFITAAVADASDVDMVLIGDSLAMTSKGYESTLQIPFDEFFYSCQSVVRGIHDKFIIADMPFGSVESSDSKCIESAVKLMSIGGIGSVKIEGGIEMVPRIRKLCELGIPVTGHIGLQPQKFNAFGGYKVQGRNADNAAKIYEDAMALQDAGCCMIVIECVPERVASYITSKLDIPTIGIGSGSGTSAQVLVFSDLLGMIDTKAGKFVQQYMSFHKDAVGALNRYDADVKAQSFPVSGKHTFKISEEEYEHFLQRTK